MDMIISIIAAVALFALLKFALKRPASFAITAAAFVLIMLNISEIKPVLETVGKTIGTNTVLGITAILMLVLLFLAKNSQAYITQVFGRSNRPTPILRIPYKTLYGVAPISCWLMIISHFVGKYAPAFVKDNEIDFSVKEGH